MPSTATKQITINLRASVAERDLIDRAAQAAGQSRSQFLLQSAAERARATLLDQTLFELDSERHRAFMARLDASSEDNPQLRALLSGEAPWDR